MNPKSISGTKNRTLNNTIVLKYRVIDCWGDVKTFALLRINTAKIINVFGNQIQNVYQMLMFY